MWQVNKFSESLGLKYPIVQAPLAGAAVSAEFIAAVSNAGCLGSLGAGYMKADDIKQTIGEIRARTTKPFAVNLFIPNQFTVTHEDMLQACTAINRCAVELAVEVLPEPGPYVPSFNEQIALLLEEKIPVFSFVFGILADKWIKAFKKNKTYLIGTATNLTEARQLEQAGVDAIVLQGSEAGGHRGGFINNATPEFISLSTLLQQVAASSSLPLIAAGGLMNGAHIIEVLGAGALGAQLGTAFLSCDESGAHPSYKKALCAQKIDDTVLTTAFSGKFARGIRNRFTDCMVSREASILDFPVQNKLTQVMRAAAKAQNNIEFMSLWAGQGVAQVRELDVSTLISTLVVEANEA